VRAPLTANEENRLQVLRRYNILDTAAEKCFDELTQLASVICETPISLISLVDENRQWFKSRVGLDVTETSRDVAFCAHAILEDDILVVEDALTDARFSDNPLVTADPHIRFYAGAPLTVIGGESLGTLCVIDHKPRDLSGRQREGLQVLCQAVVTQLELRRALNDINFMSRCLPMCAWCRSIRMDDGTWRSADKYVEDTNEVSHGICPICREQTMKSTSRVAHH
jgi:hypothetical protein